jgi:hypothetical protein
VVGILGATDIVTAMVGLEQESGYDLACDPVRPIAV